MSKQKTWKQRTGKATSILVTLLWIGAVIGGVYGYVTYQQSVAEAAKKEEAERSKEEEKKKPKLKGLQVPGLTIPKTANAKAPERTEPFKYLFSDNPSTLSSSNSSLNGLAKYKDSTLSAEELKAGFDEFMLKGIEEYQKANSEKSKSDYVDRVSKLLNSVVEESQKAEPNFEPFKEEFEEYLLDASVSRDPFFQFIAAKVKLSGSNKEDGDAEEDKKVAQQLLLGAIIDYQKWNYPARFSVMAFNERQKTKPKRKVNFRSHELHADAIVHWLQNDFSESQADHRHCWAILKDATECLCKAGKRDVIAKILEKDKEKAFIAPWLREMLAAQLQIQIGQLDFASDEVVTKAKSHLQEALKISPTFWEAENDLKVVEKLESPGGN